MKNKNSDKVSLTFDRLCGVIARLLRGRATLDCVCGARLTYEFDGRVLKKHIRHCFYWKVISKEL